MKSDASIRKSQEDEIIKKVPHRAQKRVCETFFKIETIRTHLSLIPCLAGRLRVGVTTQAKKYKALQAKTTKKKMVVHHSLE